jgi:hypothetical protein
VVMLLTMYELRKEMHSWDSMISHSPGEAIIIVNRDRENCLITRHCW